MLAMIGLVAPGEFFEPREVLAAIQDTKRHRVHLGDGDVEMGSAILNVSDDKARTVCTNPKLGIDRPNERTQLRRCHFPLWGDTKVTDAVSATLDFSQCLGIVKRRAVAGQNFDTVVLVRFV